MNFEFRRKINYYETDRMGIVHHSNYIRFLEEARCEWLKVFDISMEKLENEGITIPTLEVKCIYKYPVTSGDNILIKPIISNFNGVKMTIDYVVYDEKTGKVVIEGYTKHCFTNRELKPINIKKNNIEFYTMFEELYNESEKN